MTIKLKAPRAWSERERLSYATVCKDILDSPCPVRIVREADWKRLMRLVRACEPLSDRRDEHLTGRELFIVDALDALKGAK